MTETAALTLIEQALPPVWADLWVERETPERKTHEREMPVREAPEAFRLCSWASRISTFSVRRTSV
jgi:hypothetical protein